METKTKNMENQSRIEELLSDALRKYDQMLEKHDITNSRLEKLESRLEHIDNRLGSMDNRLGSVESEMFKLNLQTASNTRAIIDLADKLPIIFEHEKRLSKLEVTVFK
jgi:hypothetical protein